MSMEMRGSALNCLELMVDMTDETENGKKIDCTFLKEVLGERQARFDNQGDRFYDLKFLRYINLFEVLAPDAALYWYARILTAAGGDPLYVARRLTCHCFRRCGKCFGSSCCASCIGCLGLLWSRGGL